VIIGIAFWIVHVKGIVTRVWPLMVVKVRIVNSCQYGDNKYSDVFLVAGFNLVLF
jgi:hypothetical protein